ncbi:pyrroline-5-carboxylate reductase [Caulobacter segnis]|uniref:pyrroline-5-carboxylate reductase n=1 Tax=Caulobacter segnis TaxID=88688 RepID=UPI00241010F1|nr:pyrroline-5-carboxylate reductase [Caulobacter segnis]MDG2523621.1 pyrroline-5-carboxylate reductase [Caulobacter segnis]
MTPILLLGAGRMGGAIIDGWRQTGAVATSDLIIRDPSAGEAFAGSGAQVNPADSALKTAKTVILAVKPQLWRGVAEEVSGLLAKDAVIISMVAGVSSQDLSQAFGGRTVARIMPTTAVAVAKGTVSVFAAEAEARGLAHKLFDPIATTVDLTDENLMHAATAVSGSAPAYLYALVEALEGAGVSQGLTPEAASELARSTIVGAAALMGQSDTSPAELRRQVTSPNGTTQAALDVLFDENGLPRLMSHAVAAAVKRSRELG